MILLEMALQGIRSFGQMTRLTFKPGFNLVQGENACGKSTICELFLTLFTPTSEIPFESFRTSNSTGPFQAGLILRDDKGRVLRLIRDFGNGKCSLAELDEAKHFKMLHHEEEAVLRFAREELFGLSVETLRSLFLLTFQKMPSARPVRSAPNIAAGPATPPRQGRADLTPDERESKGKRLRDLKEILIQGDRLDVLEDHLADRQSKLAEANRRLRLATGKAQELEDLIRRSDAFESIGELPEDYHLVIETSENQREIMNEQLAAAGEEAEALREQRALISDQPFYLGRWFITGGVLIVASLGAAVGLNLAGIYRALALLILLTGMVLMGYAGFLDFAKVNRRKTLETRLRENERQRMRIESNFKKENAACLDLLRKSGCADIPALKSKISEYEHYRLAKRELETERDDLFGGKTIEELRAETETLRRDISEIEQTLKNSSTLPSDLTLIAEEVRTIERELAAPSADVAVAKSPAPLKAVSAEAGALPDGTPMDWVQSDPSLEPCLENPAIHSILAERLSEWKTLASRWLTRLLPRLEGEFTIGDALRPAFASPHPGPGRWETLSSGERDLAYLIYHLSLTQTIARTFPHPLFLDNPLTVLDTRRQLAILDILREMSQNRQVLLLSSITIPAQAGDHRIQL